MLPLKASCSPFLGSPDLFECRLYAFDLSSFGENAFRRCRDNGNSRLGPLLSNCFIIRGMLIGAIIEQLPGIGPGCGFTILVFATVLYYFHGQIYYTST